MGYGVDEKNNGLGVPGETPQQPDAWAKTAIIKYLLLSGHQTIKPQTHEQLMAVVCLLALIRVEVGYDAQQETTGTDAEVDTTKSAQKQHDSLAWLRVVNATSDIITNASDTPQARLSKLLEADEETIKFTSAESDSTTSLVDFSFSKLPNLAPKTTALTEHALKDKIAAMQSLGGAYGGLKAGIESHDKALGLGWFCLKSFMIWTSVFLYAAGCALAVMGGLLSKFLGSILGWMNMQPIAALLLPSFAVITFSTFFTNIKIMKSDVESFIDPLFYKADQKESIPWGEWWNTKAWPALQSALYHALLLLVSVLTGAVLGLMTWHYTLSWLPGVVASPISITVAVATFVTETMLTYNLLKGYWAPFLKGCWQGQFEAGSPWEKIQKKYHQCLTRPWKKMAFWLGLFVVSSLVVFGLIALSMSGINAIDEISFMGFMPQIASWVLLGITVLSQLPIYLAPACHLMCGLFAKKSASHATSTVSPWVLALKKHGVKVVGFALGASGLAVAMMYEIAGMAFLSSGIGIGVAVGAGLFMGLAALWMGKTSGNGSAFAETLSQYKARWAGYSLLGMGGCALLFSLMTHTAMAALLTSPAGLVVVGAGLLYGTWMLLIMHYKGLPNYARITSNAAGNSALAETTFTSSFIHVPLVGPILACVADFFNSFLCGMYGDNDGLANQDQAIDHAIALYENGSGQVISFSTVVPKTKDEETVDNLGKHDWSTST